MPKVPCQSKKIYFNQAHRHIGHTMNTKLILYLTIVLFLLNACGTETLSVENESSESVTMDDSSTVSSSSSKESSTQKDLESSGTSNETPPPSSETIPSSSSVEDISSENISSEDISSNTKQSSTAQVSDFAKIEAEEYTLAQGEVDLNEDGASVGWFDEDDALQYTVDFGTGANTILFSIATANSGVSFEIRLGSLDGEVIGTMDVSATGGWDTFVERGIPITETSGSQELYIVGTSGTEGICNIDYFQLYNIVIPISPEGLTASPADPPSNETLAITWSDFSDNETGFNVYVSRTNKKPSKPREVVPANTTTYTVEDLNSGTEYYFWVTADLNGMAESDATTTSAVTSGEPKPQEDFTIAIIGDTQSYFHGDFLAGFNSITEWIVNNKESMNIAFVSHLGDVVENGDQAWEWDGAEGALSKLDGVVPYGIAVGNHDADLCCSGGYNWASDYDNFTERFPESRYSSYEWWGDDYPAGTNWNSYQLFSAGGMDFIIVHIEVWPEADPIAWADQVLAQYPDRRALISTHDFDQSNKLAAIVNKYPNVFIVNRGHHPGYSYGSYAGTNGNTIHNFLTDPQGDANGGDGWFRYLVFKPLENKVEWFLYSDTQKYIRDQGTFTYEM